MPQNISTATGFPTTYDTGVPQVSDNADIVDAFRRYHYGPTYSGTGTTGGIEKHLSDLAASIAAIIGIPSQTGNSGKYLTTNGTTPSWATVVSGGGATGGGSDQVFYENDQVVTTNYTITTGKNAMSAGPVTVNSGVTVTVPSGSTWVIV